MTEAQMLDKKALARGAKAVSNKAKSLERLVVVYAEIDSVKPNTYNPNRQSPRDFELLCRSMKEDGFTQPIVVQKASMEIVDGEHRWRAARHIGMEKVPVVLVDMTEEQMRISTLRHNRARGSEDIEMSSQILRDLRELGALDWAADSLMIDDKELQNLLDDVSAPEELAGEDFSSSWVPTQSPSAQASAAAHRGEVAAFTDSAREQQVEFDMRMEKAQYDDEARLKLEYDMKQASYRLIVSFKDEEAALVRQILSPNPAQRILELCQKRIPKQEN